MCRRCGAWTGRVLLGPQSTRSIRSVQADSGQGPGLTDIIKSTDVHCPNHIQQPAKLEQRIRWRCNRAEDWRSGYYVQETNNTATGCRGLSTVAHTLEVWTPWCQALPCLARLWIDVNNSQHCFVLPTTKSSSCLRLHTTLDITIIKYTQKANCALGNSIISEMLLSKQRHGKSSYLAYCMSTGNDAHKESLCSLPIKSYYW